MKLTEFLEQSGISITAMAAQCNSSFHQLYNLKRGGNPSVKLACAIEHFTQGKVTPWDFLSEVDKEKITGKNEKNA